MHDETFPAPLMPHTEQRSKARSSDSDLIFKMVVGGVLALLVLAILIR